MSPIWKLCLRLHPSDLPVTLLLGIAIFVGVVRMPYEPEQLLSSLILHTGLLVFFVMAIAVSVRWDDEGWVRLVRPFATVTILFTCYSSLGLLGVTAMPYTTDAALSNLDTWLFGVDPSLFIESYLTPSRIEFFSFVYGAFIPYIYVTIVLNCLGRPPLEREQFLTGWVFLYCISYLGYIFVPARGPLILHETDYQVALSGGYFFNLVLRGVDATGGLQGAFPSLHVGGSLCLCLFELRANRLRGLIYLPLVLLIYVATLVLRYHYVVDLLAGTVIAATCLPLGRWAVTVWMGRRLAAGLPALPGGEGDVLPAISPAGAGDAEVVFSPD